MVISVAAIGCSDQWAGVNDQHRSVATEPVGEKFVAVCERQIEVRFGGEFGGGMKITAPHQRHETHT